MKALGVKPPSVADVNDMEELNNKMHGILFEAKVIVVEGLTNLALLSKPKVTFLALLLKIAGGDSVSTFAIAIEDND